MTWPEPWRQDATAIAAAVRTGTLSAEAVTASCLARIAEREPHVHAWVALDPELALSHARAVDDLVAQGVDPGPLAGVPVGVKDVFNTRDLPTQMGSPIFAGFTPGNDARVVDSLRRAGAVVLGKTVTAEFAVHAPGPTANPWDPARMAGTSSSGSAAAVADGMCPVALGTQTAGSIIRPASYCGAWGLKPSFGVVPRTATLKTTDSLDTVGLLGRSAADLRAGLEAIRVHGRDYPLVHATLDRSASALPRQAPFRLAVVRGPRFDGAEPYAQQALLDAARALDAEEVALPAGLHRAHAVHATIYDRALAYYFREEFDRRELVSDVLNGIVERGRALTVDDYREALAEQSAIAAKVDGWLAGYDAVLDLSTGGEALPGLAAEDRPDSCLAWTLCGVPAVSVPALSGPAGLPFGLQVVARRFRDHEALAAAGWAARELGVTTHFPRDVRAAAA